MIGMIEKKEQKKDHYLLMDYDGDESSDDNEGKNDIKK